MRDSPRDGKDFCCTKNTLREHLVAFPGHGWVTWQGLCDFGVKDCCLFSQGIFTQDSSQLWNISEHIIISLTEKCNYFVAAVHF